MKNPIPIFLILSFSLLVLRCKDDETPQAPSDPYEGCCGTEPVEFTVGQAKLYVPNAFTVNGDGINDVFYPFFNNHVTKIEYLSISDSHTLNVFHLVTNLDLQNPASGGWDGSIPSGGKYAGLFKYNMSVTDDTGNTRVISGSACSIVCDSAAVVFKTKTGCYYSVQQNGEGGLDASLPVLEADCF